MPFINTAVERFYGDRWFKNYCAPADFDCRLHKKDFSPYFAEHGFRVPMTYNAFFSAYNGIVSDQYLSPDLYFMYVVPALNRMEFRKALSDKSFYPILFDGECQPENIVVCASGRYYNDKRTSISRDEAVLICMNAGGGGLIVKPSVDTGEGGNVDVLDVSSRTQIENEFKEREKGSGFIVQRFVKQHSLIARMNETSLNTMRLFTYRCLDGRIVDIPRQHFLRFGGKGAYKDNVSRDGGFCHIHEDGMLDSKVLTKAVFGPMDFSARFDFKPFVVPSFRRALDFVKRLHLKLLYFDSIGWDIAIKENGEPCLIEFNVDANLRSAQMIGGPMYGEYIDEIMERVKCVRKTKIECEVNVFNHGYDRFTQIGGPEYDVL